MSGFSFNFQIDGQPDTTPTDSTLSVKGTTGTTGDVETIAAHEVWPPSGGNPFAAAQEIHLTPSCSVLVRVSINS